MLTVVELAKRIIMAENLVVGLENSPEVSKKVKELQNELAHLIVDKTFVWLDDELTAKEWETLEKKDGSNSKIQAIKLYRERTSAGLKEAKDFIEKKMMEHWGIASFPSNHTSTPQV